MPPLQVWKSAFLQILPRNFSKRCWYRSYLSSKMLLLRVQEVWLRLQACMGDRKKAFPERSCTWYLRVSIVGRSCISPPCSCENKESCEN